MNPRDLIPPLDPYGVPAPVWLFVLLLNLTLVLHFIAMGYVLAATLLHVILTPAAREGTAAEWMLRRTEGPLPVALSFTITLGVAPLLFVQVLYQPVFYTANVLIGYQWFGVILVLMAGFYLIYLLWGGKCLGRRVPLGLQTAGRLLIFGSILYVLATMTVNALLGMMPDGWKAVRESGGNFLLMHTPILLPRLLHNLLAALAIGGVWLIALGARSERLESDSDAGEPGRAAARAGATRLRKIGAMTVMAGAFLQMVVGVWLILVEKPDVQKMLFSGRPASMLWMTALLGVTVLLMLGVWTLMKRPGNLILALWGVLALILSGMFAAREASREIHLAPYMNIDNWTVKPQLSSLALFFFLFIVALGLVGLMIVWLVKGWRGEGAE
jgi:succinate dehydrogenase/fumarate reductase cytochrome b subunit